MKGRSQVTTLYPNQYRSEVETPGPSDIAHSSAEWERLSL